MILLRSENLYVQQPNVIMLENKVEDEDKYFYVSFDTYNAALKLSDRFDGDVHHIAKLINRDCHKEQVEFFFNNAPEPIDILAPFIALADEDIELTNDIELLTGVLHQVSMMIDFNNYTQVNEELRSSVTLTKSMVRAYKQSWENITMKIRVSDIDVDNIPATLIKKIVEEVFGGITLQAPTVVAGTPMQVVEPVADEEEEEEDIFAILDKAFEEQKKKEEAEADSNSVPSVSTPAAASEPVKVVEEAAEPVEEVDNRTEQEKLLDKITAMYAGGAK